MRQDNMEPARNMISMEEYLKKRQAIKKGSTADKTEFRETAASALQLAELLFV